MQEPHQAVCPLLTFHQAMFWWLLVPHGLFREEETSKFVSVTQALQH